MKRFQLFLLSLTSILCVLAQSEEEQAIVKVSRQFSQYYMKGDFVSLAGCYSEDGKIMPPNADVIEGRPLLKKDGRYRKASKY